MLSVAKPWTYWMAMPLLVGSVLTLVVGFGSVYLRKVVEPNVRRLDALAAAREAAAAVGARGNDLAPGRVRQEGVGALPGGTAVPGRR